MYHRMILLNSLGFKLLKSGSEGSLPPVLHINKEIAFKAIQNNDNEANRKTFNTQLITDSGNIMSVSDSQELSGTIGENYYEFFIDFYIENYLSKEYTSNTPFQDKLHDISTKMKKFCSNSENFVSGTEKLYTYIEEDTYKSVSKKTLLQDFYVFELNDTSYQAMTANNFDFDAKIFKDGKKIPQIAISVIKSFTFKKVWVLLDKLLLNQNGIIINETDLDNIKIFIDFKYKFFAFKKYHEYQNISNLFLPFLNSSPYYDSITINNDNGDNYSLLNKQGEYFYNKLKPSKTLKLNKNLLVNNSNTNNLTEFPEDQFKNYDSTNFSIDIKENAKSLGYEIYGYDYNTNDNHIETSGDRIILENDTNSLEYRYYEIFPINPVSAHYIFSYNNDIIDFNTQENQMILHKTLYDKNIFMYNYDFSDSVNTFEFKGKKYLELYMPIYFNGNLNIVDDSQFINETSITDFNIADLVYNGTRYDPENLSGNGNYDENLLLPYFYNDKFIKITNTSAFLIPQFVNDSNINNIRNDINIFDFKMNSIDDFNVKVLCNDNQISINDMFINNNAQIDRNKASFNIETNIEKQKRTLMKNLAMLIPHQLEKSLSDKTVKVSDCLFAYVSVSEDKKYKVIKYFNDNDSYYEYIYPVEVQGNYFLILLSEDQNNKYINKYEFLIDNLVSNSQYSGKVY